MRHDRRYKNKKIYEATKLERWSKCSEAATRGVL